MKSWIWLVLAAGAVGGGYWYWTKHAKCTTCAAGAVTKSPAQQHLTDKVLLNKAPRLPKYFEPAQLVGKKAESARPENPFTSKQPGSSGQFVPKKFGLKRGV